METQVQQSEWGTGVGDVAGKGRGGPAHSCLVGTRAQSYQSFSFFQENQKPEIGE